LLTTENKPKEYAELMRAQWLKGAEAQRNIFDLGFDMYQNEKEIISLH